MHEPRHIFQDVYIILEAYVQDARVGGEEGDRGCVFGIRASITPSTILAR